MKMTRKCTTFVGTPSLSISLSQPLRCRQLSLRLLLVGACVAAVLGGSHALFASAAADEARADPSCTALTPDWNDNSRFEDAIKDAQDIQPCERLVPLAVIRRDNPDLIWDASGTRVLVVTWTAENSRIDQQQPGTPFVLQGNELWVTTVPTLQAMLIREGTKLATSLPSEGLETDSLKAMLRTKQYLGLAEESKYDLFVEFWVKPQDLLRPCEFAVTSDVQCNTTSGQSGGIVPGSKRRHPEPDKKPSLPFTGLGYTYDWGNRVTEVGATEFVVRPGSTIEIFRNLPNAEYLQCGSPDHAADPQGRILRTCS